MAKSCDPGRLSEGVVLRQGQEGRELGLGDLTTGRPRCPASSRAIATCIEGTEFELIGCTSNDTDVVATVHWSYSEDSEQSAVAFA
jgi:hypothetical protein